MPFPSPQFKTVDFFAKNTISATSSKNIVYVQTIIKAQTIIAKNAM